MQFVNDMIHMTQGELFINYWWLWFIIIVIGLLLRKRGEK